MTDQENYDDFFQGGEKIPSFKFEGVGSGVVGTIESMTKQQQTDFSDPTKKLFFDNGDPRMQLRVVLSTTLRGWQGVAKIPTDNEGHELPQSEDDGRRAVYVKSDMQRACADAFRASGAPGPRVGGKLGVKVSGFKDVQKGNPLTLYAAMYQAPVPVEDSFFAGGQQQPQGQPAQQQGQPQYQGQQAPQQPQYQQPPAPQDPWATGPTSPQTPPQQSQYAPQQPAAAPAPQDPWAAAGQPQQPAQAPAQQQYAEPPF